MPPSGNPFRKGENMTNVDPTIADLIPPKARQWIYAGLTAANGGYLVAEAAWDVPTVVLIALGVINAAGFQLARANAR